MKRAGVAYIEREDHLILTVWNKRYGGFTLPGGMAELEESPLAAMMRETKEETDVNVISCDVQNVYVDDHTFSMDPARASQVHIYRVAQWSGEPKEMEQASPVTWLSRWQYLEWTCFPAFYARVFNTIKMGIVATRKR